MKTKDDLRTMIDLSKCDEIAGLASLSDDQPSAEALERIEALVKESTIAWPALSAQIERIRKGARPSGEKKSGSGLLVAAVADMESANILPIIQFVDKLEEEGIAGVDDASELVGEVERRLGKAISDMMGDYYDPDVICEIADAISNRIPGLRISGLWHIAKTWR